MNDLKQGVPQGTLWLCRTIATYEVVAGGIGAAGIIYSIPAILTGDVQLSVATVLLGTGIASLLGGILLWRGLRIGFTWSLYVQGAQAIGFSVPWLAFSLGLTFRSEIGWRGLGAPALPVNHFLLRVLQNEYGLFVAANIPALIAFLLIAILRIRLRR